MPDGTTFNEGADKTPTETSLSALADGVKCFALSELGEEEWIMNRLRPSSSALKADKQFL